MRKAMYSSTLRRFTTTWVPLASIKKSCCVVNRESRYLMTLVHGPHDSFFESA